MIIKMDMRAYADSVGFYGGAERVWDELSEADKDYITDICEDCVMKFNSIGEVNDFMWFEVPDILEDRLEED